MNAERREYLEMQLSAYLDGELTPREQAEVEAWLAADPEARRLLAELRATVDAIQSLPRARASEELLGNLRTRLERRALLDTPGPAEAVTRTPALWWGKWVAAAAVIALTVTAGYFTWTLRSEQNAVGSRLTRKKIFVEEPPATADRIEFGVATKSPSKPGETGDAAVTAVPAAGAPASASPARKTSEPVPGGAIAKLPEGELHKGLAGERLGSKKLDEGDTSAVALGAWEHVAGRVAGGAGEQILADKRPDSLDFAGRLEGRSAESGGRQGQYASALVPAADSADGRIRVLTFAFADASSRSKAIESLQRGLLQGEGIEEAKPSAGFPRAMRRSATTLQETRPAEMIPQPLAPVRDSGRLDMLETMTDSLESGSGRKSEVYDWEASSGTVKIASIDTNPDSPVNVLMVVTVNGASADRLVAVLNSRDWSADLYHDLAEDAKPVQLRAYKAKEGGPGPDRRPKVAVDKSADGVWGDDDGDGVPDKMGLPKAFPKPPATQPFRGSLDPSDADTVTPLDGKVTWDVTRIFENGAKHDAMTDEQGVAGQFDSLTLAPEHSNVLDAAAPPRATTLPAGSPRADASHSTSGTGMMGGMGGAGLMSGMGGGYASYGAAQGKGSTSMYAGSSPVRSSSHPASAVESRPADSNLLVVYFEVLSPDTQPAAPAASSAPASAEPTSRPAAHP